MSGNSGLGCDIFGITVMESRRDFRLEFAASVPAPGVEMDHQSAAAPSGVDAGVQLVPRIQAGDTLAEEEFVKTYRRGLLVIATVRTRDREAAQDLTQEILIAVLQAIRAGQLREAEKLGAFVHGTARNIINNYLRVKTRRPETDLDGVAEPSVDPVEQLESDNRRQLVRRELQTFSPADQQILLLSLVDGHPLAEVAQRLSLSHDAVRARKSRMIKKIVKKFAPLSQKRIQKPPNPQGAL
jgi:RNA polymerase sigma factor (sigma-70 family)